MWWCYRNSISDCTCALSSAVTEGLGCMASYSNGGGRKNNYTDFKKYIQYPRFGVLTPIA